MSKSLVFLPAVIKGTSGTPGPDRATRPTGKTLIWPSLDFFPYTSFPASSQYVCHTKPALFLVIVLLSRCVQIDCEITAGGQKWKKELKDDLSSAPLFFFLSGWCHVLCEEFIYCISCHALIDSFFVFFVFLINQGLPGPTGLKGDRGDGGHPVRPLFLSKLLTSIVAHHALFVFFLHLFIFLLFQTGTTWDARSSRA